MLDEGHALKKLDSSRYERLSQLSAVQRLLLTGTPVQNRLSELLVMLSFAVPHVIPPSLPPAFEHVERARAGGNSKGKGREVGGPEVARARRMLAPFVLRRKKVDVLSQLVHKREIERMLPMGGRQKAVYGRMLFEAKESITPAKEGEKANGARRSARGGAQAGASTTIFWNLRKAANHPCLLRDHYSDADLERIARSAAGTGYFGGSATIKHVRAEVATYSDAQLHVVCNEVAGLTDLALCLCSCGILGWAR